jgi:hypothetical protein
MPVIAQGVNIMKKSCILSGLLFLSLLISSCSNPKAAASKGWDGGDFTGQPVYDLTNERFSNAAIEALKNCGAEDTEIETLAKQSLPSVKEITGTLSGIQSTFSNAGNNKDIANISLDELRSNIFKVGITCIAK